MTREFTGTDDFIGITKNITFRQTSSVDKKRDTLLYCIDRMIDAKNPNRYRFLSYAPDATPVGEFNWTIEERDFPRLLEQLKNRFGSGLVMSQPNRFRQVC